jgi:predicted nucleotidyltransferase component of viral defense system
MMSGLHFNCISEELRELIEGICSDAYFENFRLFGGTALSLHKGHRISVDADFIAAENFPKNQLANKLLQSFPDRLNNVVTGELGVFAQVNGIKLDFLSWNQPFIREAERRGSIRIMHTEEIIAHKLFAILNRGEKKDYVDIAFLLEDYSLQEMISFYAEKYNKSNTVQLLKYLLSYGDIDFQPMPLMTTDVSWEYLKLQLKEAVQEYSGL